MVWLIGKKFIILNFKVKEKKRVIWDYSEFWFSNVVFAMFVGFFIGVILEFGVEVRLLRVSRY